MAIKVHKKVPFALLEAKTMPALFMQELIIDNYGIVQISFWKL